MITFTGEYPRCLWTKNICSLFSSVDHATFFDFLTTLKFHLNDIIMIIKDSIQVNNFKIIKCNCFGILNVEKHLNKSNLGKKIPMKNTHVAYKTYMLKQILISETLANSLNSYQIKI